MHNIKEKLIDGLYAHNLRIIENKKGDVMHALKNDSLDFNNFGEAYFSEVMFGEIKGWKKHNKMIMNLIVPYGSVNFTIFDDRSNSNTKGKKIVINLSKENYKRLTIYPGLWFAFEGMTEGINLILNISNIIHDPNEADSANLNQFLY